jgi:hypothetical protein
MRNNSAIQEGVLAMKMYRIFEFTEEEILKRVLDKMKWAKISGPYFWRPPGK